MLDFAVAACTLAGIAGGFMLGTRIFRGRFAPWPLSLTHAAFGTTAILLAVFSAYRGIGLPNVNGALFMLIITAIGGFSLARLHWRQQIPRTVLIFLHVTFAVIGFGLLVSAAMST